MKDKTCSAVQRCGRIPSEIVNDGPSPSILNDRQQSLASHVDAVRTEAAYIEELSTESVGQIFNPNKSITGPPVRRNTGPS